MSGGGFTFALNLPSSIAIDSTGNAWVTNKGNNTISRFSAAGAPIGAPLTAGGLNQPRSIAFDSLGNAWIANAGNASVSKFTSAGTAVSGASGFTGAGIVSPVGIVVSPH
jgi:DNA-binding beta-propeller fold protein YncE